MAGKITEAVKEREQHRKRGAVRTKPISPAKNAPPGEGVKRLTDTWPDKKGRDVAVKAEVAFDGKRWIVGGRFTAHKKDGLVPSLALKPKSGGGKGKHVVSREATLAS
jgi:hypothetical protein